MKKFLFLISFYPFSPSFGQIDNSGIISKIQATPELLPPSPKAAELGKYGDVPIGLFTGAMQYSVPIYNLKVGSLNLPISIDYSANGIKVSQSSTNVGLSWSLNAGGVITRTIMGGDDLAGDLDTPPANINDPGYFYGFDMSNETPIVIKLVYANMHQTWQPDIFYFNFSGYTGKFIIDQSGAITTIPYQNIKIEKTTVNSTENHFTVTTPNGNKYFFNKTEKTQYQTEGTNCDPGVVLSPAFKETTWYLTKILSPISDSITFEYEAESYNYYTGISQSMSILHDLRSAGWEFYCRGGIFANWKDTSYTSICNVPTTANISTCKSLSYIQGFVLKSIQASNGEKLVFTNSNRTDINGSKKTDKIEIYSTASAANPMFGYNMYYSNDIHNYRMYLDSIVENTINPTKRKHYGFSYDHINELPIQTSLSQDKYGYYNGINNSYYFTPQIPGHFYYDSHHGNRTSSDYSTWGMLSKISYPTGGFSEIKYDQHRIRRSYLSYEEITDEVGASLSSWGDGSNMYTGLITLDTTFTTPNTGYMDSAIVRIRADYRNFEDPYAVDPNYQSVEYEIKNMNTGQILKGLLKPILPTTYYQPISGVMYASTELYPSGYEKFILCGLDNSTTYKITLKIHGSDQVFGLLGIGTIHHTGNYHTVPRVRSEAYGGARVESIVSHDQQTGRVTVKKFYYDYLDSIKDGETGSSLHLVNSYDNFQYSRSLRHCSFQVQADLFEVYIESYYDQVSSNAISLSLGGNHIYYKSVVIGNGNNFEGGGEEHKFNVVEDQLAETIYLRDSFERILNAPLTNTGFMNGTEIYSSLFRKSGTSFTKFQETFNTYTVEPILHAKDIYGYMIVQLYDLPASSTTFVQQLPSFKIAAYKNISRWYYLSCKKTLTYSSSIGSNPIVQTVNYYYDNPLHVLPTRIERSTSDGSIITQLTTYPLDYPIGTSFIDDMRTKNLINYPIEKVTYKTKGTARSILSGNLSIYLNGGQGLKAKDWSLELSSPLTLSSYKFSNRPIGILPIGGTATPFVKDSRYKIQLNYDRYDSKGNLLSYTSTGSKTTALLWGYNYKYLVAEINNIDTSVLTSYLNANPAIIGTINAPSTDQTLRNTIQQLRTQFPAALINSYTYVPSIGVNSETDAKNKTTFYEYDDLGRLTVIKDANNSIIKKYTYQYQGPQ